MYFYVLFCACQREDRAAALWTSFHAHGAFSVCASLRVCQSAFWLCVLSWLFLWIFIFLPWSVSLYILEFIFPALPLFSSSVTIKYDESFTMYIISLCFKFFVLFQKQVSLGGCFPSMWLGYLIIYLFCPCSECCFPGFWPGQAGVQGPLFSLSLIMASAGLGV